MAFNKRLWKGRQGTGLNKFSINGATPVTVINQPDSVTEQGDALSAGNLNDLEDRIYDAFEDIADGTQVVGKATADASGNVITTTYETKADASDLKSAIDRNTAEIENLKQTSAQTEITVSYPDDGNYSALMPNLVPQKSAKYAEIKSINGKSRAWNQLVKNGNFASTQNWTSNTPDEGPLSASSNIGKITLTSSVSSAGIYQNVNSTSGHKILVHFRYKVTTSVANPRVRVVFSNGGSGDEFTETCTSGIWLEVCHIVELTNSWSRFYMLSSYGVAYATGDTFEFGDVFLRDLTTILSDWSASDITTANIPLMVKKIPDLLKPDAYGTSIVDTTVEGVKSVGVNIWDEEWETGQYNPSNGQPMSVSGAIRSKNYIQAKALTEYLVRLPSGVSSRIFFFDADKNFIGTVGEVLATTISGTAYIKFHTSTNYGNSYANNIQVCLNSLPDAVKTTYHSHMTDTLSLPTPVTLRSAGTVADTDELNVEVLVDGVKVNRRRQTVRVYEEAVKYNGWKSSATTTHAYKVDTTFLAKKVTSNLDIPDITCASFVTMAWNDAISFGKRAITMNIAGEIFLSFGLDSNFDTLAKFKTWLENNPVNITYALAEESITLLDPIENNTIQVEGNGTVETVQDNTYPDDSPAPTIDNSMTVNFDLIP